MNRDLIKVIEQNIANLRYSVEFDRFDFSPDQQEIMLRHVDAIQEIVSKVKSESRNVQ